LHVTGTSTDALRSVAITARDWARGNPDAVNREPLDDADYDPSPMIAEPLRLLDCARRVPGAVAVVLAGRPSAGGARLRIGGTGREHPVRRRRAGAESWFGGGGRAVQDALDQAGIVRADLHVAELYAPF